MLVRTMRVGDHLVIDRHIEMQLISISGNRAKILLTAPLAVEIKHIKKKRAEEDDGLHAVRRMDETFFDKEF